MRSPEPDIDYATSADIRFKAVSLLLETHAAPTYPPKNALLQLGLTGVTFVTGSGDDGSHFTDPACSTPVAVAQWPASSPYVLSVGATEFDGGGIPKTKPENLDCGYPGVSVQSEH